MEYYTMTTNAGDQAIAHAIQTGTTTTFKQIAVGDGNGTYYEPVKTQTTLRREVWRGNTAVSLDVNNPKRVIVTATIPATVGGFTVREAGIFDTANTLMVVSKLPLSEKVAPESGASSDLVIRLYVEVSDAGAVTITVDPSAVMATKADVASAVGPISTKLNTHVGDDIKHTTQEDKDKIANAVPNTRKVNGHALTGDIVVTAADVGASNPNLLIDGEMIIWSDGSSLTGLINGKYGPDVWRMFTDGIVAVSKIGGGMSVTRTGGTFVTAVQYLESSIGVFGKTVTLSADIDDVRYSATALVTTQRDFDFDGGRIVFTLGTGLFSSTYYAVGVAVKYDAGVTHTIKNIKLELGGVSTPYAPSDYSKELPRTLRFYQRFNVRESGHVFNNIGSSVSSLGIPIQHIVPMRISPTRSFVLPTGGCTVCDDSNANYTVASIAYTGSAYMDEKFSFLGLSLSVKISAIGGYIFYGTPLVAILDARIY
jgi:hypothetical protein